MGAKEGPGDRISRGACRGGGLAGLGRRPRPLVFGQLCWGVEVWREKRGGPRPRKSKHRCCQEEARHPEKGQREERAGRDGEVICGVVGTVGRAKRRVKPPRPRHVNGGEIYFPREGVEGGAGREAGDWTREGGEGGGETRVRVKGPGRCDGRAGCLGNMGAIARHSGSEVDGGVNRGQGQIAGGAIGLGKGGSDKGETSRDGQKRSSLVTVRPLVPDRRRRADYQRLARI